MGCINSVPKTATFSVSNNDAFCPVSSEDIINGVTYIRNMNWCTVTSKSIENLCFLLASYSLDEIAEVKSCIELITSSKYGKSPAVLEFKALTKFIDDIGTMYLEAMTIIRRHSAAATKEAFNDVAKFLRFAVLAPQRRTMIIL